MCVRMFYEIPVWDEKIDYRVSLLIFICYTLLYFPFEKHKGEIKNEFLSSFPP